MVSVEVGTEERMGRSGATVGCTVAVVEVWAYFYRQSEREQMGVTVKYLTMLAI